MITSLNALMILVIAFAVLVVFRVQQKKEHANRVAICFCHQNQIQLLDGTVAFRGWHITRPRFAVAFRFQFEYSSDRANRHCGYISLIGNQVENIFIDQTHLVEDISKNECRSRDG